MDTENLAEGQDNSAPEALDRKELLSQQFDAVEKGEDPAPVASGRDESGRFTKGRAEAAPAEEPPLWFTGKEHGLDGLALTRIAGTYFTGIGEPYPHDGMASRTSVFARDADPVVFPPASCHEVPDVHSISFARVMDLEWERSITWDPRVMDLVVAAIARA